MIAEFYTQERLTTVVHVDYVHLNEEGKLFVCGDNDESYGYQISSNDCIKLYTNEHVFIHEWVKTDFVNNNWELWRSN